MSTSAIPAERTAPAGAPAQETTPNPGASVATETGGTDPDPRSGGGAARDPAPKRAVGGGDHVPSPAASVVGVARDPATGNGRADPGPSPATGRSGSVGATTGSASRTNPGTGWSPTSTDTRSSRNGPTTILRTG